MRLLPDWARWRATFSTYFLQPVAGTPCAWRFCLEGTPAADAARQSMASGAPQLLDFGISDERAWEVGLSCGGKVKVFVEPLS
jgi:hypothetical protein